MGAARLPHTVATRILSFLDAPSVVNMGTTNKAWNKAHKDDAVWKDRAVARFKDDSLLQDKKGNSSKPPTGSWYLFFASRSV